MKPNVWLARNRVKALPEPIFVQRNDKVVIDGCKNFKKSQGIVSRISLNMSGTIGSFP